MHHPAIQQLLIMATPQTHPREDFQIAAICALPLKYHVAELACDQILDEQDHSFGKALGDYNDYTLGRVGSHNVVIALLPGMGKARAAAQLLVFDLALAVSSRLFCVAYVVGCPPSTLTSRFCLAM